MIQLYSGTPGSGKSYHTAYKLYYGLRYKRNFICNFDINIENVSLSLFSYWKKKLFPNAKKLRRKKLGKFVFVSNDELTPEYLLNYAKKNHSLKKEGETTIVIDECGIIFNPRGWDNRERMKWIQFFSMHRHYGFDVILISQTDRMIDRQIRGFVEYEIKHRKLNNFKLFGRMLGLLSGGCLFGCVKIWYGIREKVGFEMVRYNKRIASIYDTFHLFFEKEEEKIPEEEVQKINETEKEVDMPVVVPGDSEE